MRKFLHAGRSSLHASSHSFGLEPLEVRRMLSSAVLATDPVAQIGVTEGVIAQSITSEEFKEIAINAGSLNYWAPFWPFADALKMESRGFQKGSPSGYTVVPVEELDARGFVVTPGIYNAKPFENTYAPAGAPKGLYVVTWEGTGDAQLTSYSGGSEGGVTLVGGSVAEKRLVYQVTTGARWWPKLRVNNVATDGDYVKNIHIWMPDPADPYNKSLEPAPGQEAPLWHPQYLDHLRELSAHLGYIRFMDWTHTNASPQVNWSDARPADHAFATGKTNYKTLNIPGLDYTNPANAGKYGTIGVAWEWVIDLCNTLNVSPWINVPHAATDDYVTQLAKLFGGELPSSPGLNPGLKIYLEYSNEIWSSGSSFAQGDWATQQSQAQGILKGAFNGRRSVEVFRLFDLELASTPNGARDQDVVRVGAGFTEQDFYNDTYLTAAMDWADNWVGTEGKLYKPDVFANATYFGGSALVKYAFNEAAWLTFDPANPSDAAINQVIDYWVNDILTGLGVTRNPLPGGFGSRSSATAQKYGIPLLAYEGGPAIDTGSVTYYVKDGKIVSSDTEGATKTSDLGAFVKQNYGDDYFTKFMLAINANPRMADVYAAFLQMYKGRGLKTHAGFNDIGEWNKYGQWGHKEYLDQPSGFDLGEAVKWEYLKNYAIEEESVRDLDSPLGLRPLLPTSKNIGQVFAGASFSYDINAVSLGDSDGSMTESIIEMVAGVLPPGMSFTQIDGDTARLSGIPTKGGTYRILVRILDRDRDAAYAVYTLEALGGTAATTSIAVSHDTFATQGSTSTVVSGYDTSMLAGSFTARTGYLKFDLSPLINAEIDNARLRLYVLGWESGTKPLNMSLSLQAIPDYVRGSDTVPWTEDMGANQMPNGTVTITGSSKVLGADYKGWVEFDLTDYLKSGVLSETDRTVSVGVRGQVDGGSNLFIGVRIASKEREGGALAPQLILNQSVADNITPLRADFAPISPNPSTTKLSDAILTAPTVTFTTAGAVAVTGFDPSDLVLKRNGITLSLSGVTLYTVDNKTFSILGLGNYTATSGLYSLSLKSSGTGIYETATPSNTLIASDAETWSMTGPSSVEGRWLYYNNSKFDGNSVLAGSSDDAARATDKVALRPGAGKATFANYSSYSKGINGVFVDIKNLPWGELISTEDFDIRVGNAISDSGNWAKVSVQPEIFVRRGAGVNGSDRVTLVWPDNAVRKQWLKITTKVTSKTGLTTADTFYFGNAIGETGGEANAKVDGTDVTKIRSNQSGLGSANILNVYDIDRSGKVDGTDLTLARENQSGLTPLQLLQV